MTRKTAQPQTEVKPVYVLAGKDNFLLISKTQELLDSFIAPDERQTSLFNVDPDQVTITEILDELRTLPFLSSRRVVLIKNADDFVSDNREKLEKYFDSPSKSGVLVLAVRSWPKTTRLAKKLDSVGELIDVGEITRWQLPQFVVEQAKKLDKSITTQAAQLLVELVGDDTGALCRELDKLCLLADTSKSITPTHIEALVGHNRIFDAFSVMDAIAAGSAAQAIERLRNMFAGDKSAEYTVVGAFAFHIRKLFSAKALIVKGSNPAQVATKLGIWRDKQQGFFAQLAKYSLEQIGRLLQDLAAIDHQIKTGQMSAAVAMEQFIFSLTAK